MNRDNEIEDLAEFIAKDQRGIGRVDPAAIAAAYDITFNFGHYEDAFDGLLECKASRFHIYVNADSNRGEDSPRARFSFAHELGHYFLDWHRCALERGAPSHGSQSDFESAILVEREADLFAANLLLPREDVRRAAGKHVGADEILRLADAFGTSLSATAIRCAHLNLAPLIVMRWSSSGRVWCWSSERYAQLTGNRSYRALERIPADSVTRQTINHCARNDQSPRKRGTTLATWFPSIWRGSATDEILVEECIGLGRYGALTILRPA
jgi:Zn-dependent peptidase ImmA (M78 family)